VTYTAGTVLAIALAISVAGSIVTYVSVRGAFAQHAYVDQAQASLSTLYVCQLKEDTALRDFLGSGDRAYLEPFQENEKKFDGAWRDLRSASASAKLLVDGALLADLFHTHERWISVVANPLSRRPNEAESADVMTIDKLLTGQFQQDFNKLQPLYVEQAQAASDRIQDLLRRAAISTAALILLFGCAAIIADLYRSRTQAALEKERTVADALQRAFLSGWDALPYLHVGTAYVSSTREAAIGGDLFDIHRVDDHRTLVLVADVSGKGLDAAVETAQVKYSIRTLVEDYADPAVVLAKFNRSFIRSQRDPSSFVSAFVGMFDDRDWTLRYASAGHSPTYVRRSDWVEQLPVTGPLVGIDDSAAFSSLTVAIAPGDTIVLATDGLTEARDNAGVPVDDDGVIRWIRDGEREPEHLASELISKVTRFAGGSINDDLALLVIRVDRPVPRAGSEALDASGTAAARAADGR
jgi:serine phosphatase RsbU (regulator of sigma subunit)/CHASE3 domain sensor protein